VSSKTSPQAGVSQGERELRMENCVFCDIAAGRSDTALTFETEHVAAFPDINPVAPLHVLIVSKAHISSAAELDRSHSALLADVFAAAKHTLEKSEFDTYRLVSNVGPEGGQVIPHLHFHLLAGREFGDPTGSDRPSEGNS
jgi:histidine triad (HIT) family protein